MKKELSAKHRARLERLRMRRKRLKQRLQGETHHGYRIRMRESAAALAKRAGQASLKVPDKKPKKQNLLGRMIRMFIPQKKGG